MNQQNPFLPELVSGRCTVPLILSLSKEEVVEG
jgi:hypothetical protein